MATSPPTIPVQLTDFEDYSTNNPEDHIRGTDLDAEFEELRSSSTETINRLAEIQRADGALYNGIVTQVSLSADLRLGLSNPTAWATATAYAQYDTVFQNNAYYICDVAHTSGTFSTDYTTYAYWTLLADFTTGTISGLTPTLDSMVIGNGSAWITATPAAVKTALSLDNAGVKTAYEANADTNAFTDAEQTKLAAIKAAADVTDATNVAAAGAVMDSDILDEDDMATDSATQPPSQQSTAAFAIAQAKKWAIVFG